MTSIQDLIYFSCISIGFLTSTYFLGWYKNKSKKKILVNFLLGLTFCYSTTLATLGIANYLIVEGMNQIVIVLLRICVAAVFIIIGNVIVAERGHIIEYFNPKVLKGFVVMITLKNGTQVDLSLSEDKFKEFDEWYKSNDVEAYKLEEQHQAIESITTLYKKDILNFSYRKITNFDNGFFRINALFMHPAQLSVVNYLRSVILGPMLCIGIYVLYKMCFLNMDVKEAFGNLHVIGNIANVSYSLINVGFIVLLIMYLIMDLCKVVAKIKISPAFFKYHENLKTPARYWTINLVIAIIIMTSLPMVRLIAAFIVDAVKTICE